MAADDHVRASNTFNEGHVKQLTLCLLQSCGLVGCSDAISGSSGCPSPPAASSIPSGVEGSLSSLELRVVPAPKREAGLTPLYFDALTFSAEICPLNDWCLARMCTRVWMLVHGLRAIGFSLTVFIGAVSHTDSRWQRRREREMQRFERPMPQGFSALIGEAYRAAGVPVYYSVTHSNEDTLAAYAHLHGAAVLSRDGCFLRYRDSTADLPASFIRMALLFCDYEVKGSSEIAAALPAGAFAGTSLLDCAGLTSLPCQLKLLPPRAAPRGDLHLQLDPPPFVRCEEGSLADAFMQRKYIRGCPSPLMRILGADPHAATRPLRQALFRLMLEKRAEVALRAPSVFEEPPRKREARSAAAVEAAAAGSRVIAAAVRSVAGLDGAGGADGGASAPASSPRHASVDNVVAIAEKWALWDCVADRPCWYDSAALETDLIVSLLHADPSPAPAPAPAAAPTAPATATAAAPASAANRTPYDTASGIVAAAAEAADPAEADPSPPVDNPHAVASGNAAAGAESVAAAAVGGAGAGDTAADRMRQLLLGHPFDAMRELFPVEAACLRTAAMAVAAGPERPVSDDAAAVVTGAPSAAASFGADVDAEDPLVAASSEPPLASDSVPNHAAGVSTPRREGQLRLPGLSLPSPGYSAVPGIVLAHRSSPRERVYAMPMPPAIQAALRKLDGSRQAEIKHELWYKHVFGCASTVAEVYAAATGKSYLSALIAMGF